MDAASAEGDLARTADRSTHREPVPLRALLVLLLAAALSSVTGLLVSQDAHAPALVAGPRLPWWLLAGAFAVTESVVMHLQVKREAQTISLSELPLVLALCFASPMQLLIGRLLGSLVVFVAVRRTAPLKVVFNLALVSAETTVAVVTFRAGAAWSAGLSPLLWLSAYPAIHLANALSVLALGTVIALYERTLNGWRLLQGALLGDPAAPCTVTIALVAVTSLHSDLQSAWLLLACAVMLLLAYRSYAALADRHLGLERLYGFSRAVSAAPEVEKVLRNVLTEARRLLHAEHAEVTFVTADGTGLARVALGGNGRIARSEEPQTSADRWLLHQVLDHGEPLLLPRGNRDPHTRAWLAARGLREAVAVPLHGTAGTVGVLVVGDRMGDVRTYDDGDVQLLDTVATHASVVLQNGQLTDQLHHESVHDALTGLPNRLALQRQLARTLDDVHAGRNPGIGVLLLDLDDFKDVNDSLGHDYGDRLLKDVAGRLVRAAGPHGFVARLGGDEFAVLITDTAREDDALRFGRRLLQALQPPVTLDGLEITVRASIGVALAPTHASDAATLLKRADLAMYDAKSTTRGLCLYHAHLDTPDPGRLALVSELRAALEDEQIEVHVQPQGELASGRVVAVEALVRWRHPRLGNVSPEEFIPLAERSGMIGSLTSRVLADALAAGAHWRAAGRELGVAVNLSARSLADPDLVQEVTRALAQHGVPSHLLTLEVTEGSVMADPARAMSILHQLRDLGVRLSVDDFGTGYSSLSYLKRLPVQEVKIDRSFITGLSARGKDLAIVRAIVDLGRHLDLQVIAEGVEDIATWDLLASIGCDLAQGWHLSRPMPVSELLPWLTTHTATLTPQLPDPSHASSQPA